MIKQDFLMRIVEQLALALGHVLQLRAKGFHEEALQATDDALQKLVGLDFKFVNMLALKDLLALLKPGIDLDVTRALVIAELFKERGDLWEIQNQEDLAFAAHAKALTLYLEIFTGPGQIDLPAQREKTEALVENLEEFELPYETRLRLFRYFDKTKRYAQAEDFLTEIVENGERQGADDPFGEGIAFYKNLLLKSDEDLEAGDLPREDVMEGLARLRGLGREELK